MTTQSGLNKKKLRSSAVNHFRKLHTSEAVEEMGVEFPNLADEDWGLFNDPLFKNQIKNALFKINDKKNSWN